MAKQSIENEMKKRGWAEVSSGCFYRDNGNGMAQSVQVSDWGVDAVEFAQKAERAQSRPTSKQYWLTYSPTII